MLLTALAFAAALQQPVPQEGPASPIARVVVTPADPVVQAQDTLRLRAQALDAQGRPIPNATFRFVAAGGDFEGEVESTGLVRSGSTGTIPVTVMASVPGSRPVLERVQVRMVPGPAARVEMEPRVPRMVVGQQVRLSATAYSAEGDRRDERPRFTSSAPGVVSVSEDGRLVARSPGRATVTAAAGSARAEAEVTVVAGRVETLELTPPSTDARTGDVIRFRAVARDGQGRVIEGLTPAFSFFPGHGTIDADGAFVGYERGAYTVTATLGDRSAQAVVNLVPRDVRRPATVVGRLPRTAFSTEEVWLHPNGRIAYLGTGGGGDRLYAIDVSNPARPFVTDSLVVDTRRVNDLMTTPDGAYLVFTRENASNRRNGIVIASLEDPAHPRIVANFTEGVEGGVHSAFVYRQPRHGTHVYATNNATGALHVIDIGDPLRPRTAAVWKTDRPDAGRSLHDVDVQDGLAYLSYWNDGLVILDVGNGIRGGTPSSPQLVSQFRYDLNDLYRQVEATGGPGFIRGTHSAWRHRDYVFIADEVFPASPVAGARDAAAGRAYGRLQVLDVSDITKPRSVAFYEPEYGGVHNLWAAGDTLYMGAYNAGFRAFDISGELRGDLRAQQREMVHVNTADMQGRVQNAAMTWGVVVRDGLAYVNDMNNGLWIIRMEPPPASLAGSD
jgi:hypothetical protein